MDTRIDRPVPFSREARLHSEIPTTPVYVRIKDIQACYNRKNEKLVLGQRHTSNKSSRKGDKRHKRGNRNRRSKSPGRNRASAGPDVDKVNPLGGPLINLEESVSMLSIGSVIDEFKSLLTHELSVQGSETGVGESLATGLPSKDLSNRENSTIASSQPTNGIAPLRKRQTSKKYPFEEVKLYCRYPGCNGEFKNAFDLYVHSRKEHAHQAMRPFKEPVLQATRPNTTGSIDPFHKRPPVKLNCSGILPAVPKSRPPSPDATGVVWGVDVLNQQRKWSELLDAERFREHTKDLKKANAQLTLELDSGRFALNKSNANMAKEKRLTEDL